VLCTGRRLERAEALAAQTGGQALPGNGDLADRSDLIVLCHKPAQLQEVAAQVGGRAKGVVSILGGSTLAELKAAYPGIPVTRVLPSTPVEVRKGVTVQARDDDGDREHVARTTELFERVGTVVVLPEAQIDAAMGLMSCAPAYMALVAEAQVDAGVRFGIPAELGAQLVTQTMAGTAALLEHRGNDTLAVRREVTSPGGLTAKGLKALEQENLRRAFMAAMEATATR
jgi:pyrroline-5-carboxylate reductase